MHVSASADRFRALQRELDLLEAQARTFVLSGKKLTRTEAFAINASLKKIERTLQTHVSRQSSL